MLIDSSRQVYRSRWTWIERLMVMSSSTLKWQPIKRLLRRIWEPMGSRHHRQWSRIITDIVQVARSLKRTCFGKRPSSVVGQSDAQKQSCTISQGQRIIFVLVTTLQPDLKKTTNTGNLLPVSMPRNVARFRSVPIRSRDDKTSQPLVQ